MSEAAYTIDDPRPIAEEAPYTFFLPSPEQLAALAPGDLAQLIFRPTSGDRKWGAERMWVWIDRIDGDMIEGTLGNEPEDMPGIDHGERVRFLRSDVIGCVWSKERTTPPPPSPTRREYWERCLVDRCVIDERVPVHFLYREDPEPMAEGDRDPDSGWRIRGDYRDLPEAEIDDRRIEYVAIARVLNADDTWLHLIDAPVGSAFIRDWESGELVPEA